MIKLIFIDIDNTLLDFDEYVKRSLEDGFKKYNLRIYEPWMYDIFTEENNKFWSGLEQGTVKFEDIKKDRFNTIFKRLDINFDGVTFETYFREYLNESAILIDGAIEMLEELSKDYILCTASNGPFNQQMHRLEIGHISQYFKYNFISEDLGASKPSKEFFDKAFDIIKEDIKPEECLIIGDSISSDMNGGKNYGIKTCFFDKHNKEIIPSDVDLSTNDLTNIPQIIKQL